MDLVNGKYGSQIPRSYQALLRGLARSWKTPTQSKYKSSLLNIVSCPDRKFPSFVISNFIIILRSNSEKKFYGPLSLFLFSWFVARFLFLELCHPNRLILFTGFESFWPLTVERLWNSVFLPSSLLVWSCNFWLEQRLLKSETPLRRERFSRVRKNSLVWSWLSDRQVSR